MKNNGKRKTICFYTDNGLYMGWKYLDLISYGEIKSWLKSGNSIKSNNVSYNTTKDFASSLNINLH